MDGEVEGPMVVAVTGPQVGRALRLRGAAAEIGRGPASDLVLEQEGVADRHASLEYREGGWVIVDRSEGRGLSVNDTEVDEHRLASGDRIHLGEAVLVYLDPQQDLRAWLTAPTSVEHQDPRMSSGFLVAKWRALEAFIEPGDELWCFSSSPESWRRLSGRGGLCVVRGGAVVYTLVTEMN